MLATIERQLLDTSHVPTLKHLVIRPIECCVTIGFKGLPDHGAVAALLQGYYSLFDKLSYEGLKHWIRQTQAHRTLLAGVYGSGKEFISIFPADATHVYHAIYERVDTGGFVCKYFDYGFVLGSGQLSIQQSTCVVCKQYSTIATSCTVRYSAAQKALVHIDGFSFCSDPAFDALVTAYLDRDKLEEGPRNENRNYNLKLTPDLLSIGLTSGNRHQTYQKLVSVLERNAARTALFDCLYSLTREYGTKLKASKKKPIE